MSVVAELLYDGWWWWLLCFMCRIARNSSNVVCPVIDVINDDTLEYQGRKQKIFQKIYFKQIFCLLIKCTLGICYSMLNSTIKISSKEQISKCHVKSCCLFLRKPGTEKKSACNNLCLAQKPNIYCCIREWYVFNADFQLILGQCRFRLCRDGI